MSVAHLLRNVSPQPKFEEFFAAGETVIIGKRHELQLALTCLLSSGHLLIEDLPGMGKTTFVMLLARLCGLEMKRIQFTNDLLPSDILGTNVFDPRTQLFQFHKGPIFGQVILGDELNRATPKTQSAFLQAMEEHKITIDGQTYDLPKPFFLIATQNPSQQVGTYPLPESQLDRFSLRLRMGYPDPHSEKKILSGQNPRSRLDDIKPVLNEQQLLEWQKNVLNVYVADPLVDYVQRILHYSRSQSSNTPGLSPRAGLLLLQTAKAWAFLQGRNMVIPEDVRAVGIHVVAHRLSAPTDTDSFAGDRRAEEIFNQVKMP